MTEPTTYETMPPGFITSKMAEKKHGVKRATLGQWCMKKLVGRAFLRLAGRNRQVIFCEADIEAQLEKRTLQAVQPETEFINPMNLRPGQKIRALHTYRGYLTGLILDRIPRNGALIIQCQKNGKITVLPTLLKHVKILLRE